MAKLQQKIHVLYYSAFGQVFHIKFGFDFGRCIPSSKHRLLARPCPETRGSESANFSLSRFSLERALIMSLVLKTTKKQCRF